MSNTYSRELSVNLNEMDKTYFTRQEIKSIFQKIDSRMKLSKMAIATLNELLSSHGMDIARRAVMIARQTNKPGSNFEITATMIKKAQQEMEQSSMKPLFHYCWVIHENGSCLFSKSYSGLRFPDTLFSGLIIGIVDVMHEVTGRFPTFIKLGDLSVHLRRYGILTIVIISDTEETRSINHLAKEIGRKFYQKYERYLEKEEIFDLSTFETFAEDLDLIAKQSGLTLPQHLASEVDEAHMLSMEQIEDTVAAAALREEILRATQQIRQLPIFKNPATSEMRKIDERLPSSVRASSKVVRKLSPQRIKKAISEDIQKAEEIFSKESRKIDFQLDKDLKRIQEEKSEEEE